MNTRAFDIAPNDVTHFARVKGLANVIIGPKPQRFLGSFQGTEAGQHDDGKMRIDLANFAQTIDSGHTGHPDVHHDCVGLFLFQEFHSRFDAIRRVHLIVRLQ